MIYNQNYEGCISVEYEGDGDEFEGVISLRDYDLLAILALGVIFTGILINWISTFFAVNKYLNMKTDKLY